MVSWPGGGGGAGSLAPTPLPPTISYLSGNFGIVEKIGSSVKQSLFTIMTYLIGLFRYLFMFSIGPIRILS